MSSQLSAPQRTQSAPPPITVEDVTSPEPARKIRLDYLPKDAQDPIAEDHSSRNKNKPHAWHHRKRSPGVEWHTKLSKSSFNQGRVLLIDYVSKDHTEHGRRKIVAQEFNDLDSLRRFYSNQHLSTQAALRVIHVQSASWATQYLLRKFNIDHHDDLVGTQFGRWAKYDRPQRRAGKPVLNGKTFRTQRDPWRAISRTAFGLDYLKQFDPQTPARDPDDDVKMMELNGYSDNDNPSYMYDVFVQRLSVYVQRKEEVPDQPLDLGDIRNPYNEEEFEEHQRWKKQHRKQSVDEGKDRYIPRLNTLDNGNTIIVFEHSHSGSVDDTLIGARQEIESRWRRLTFYLSRDEASTDERLAIECMELILKDIFKGLALAWEKYLNCAANHVSILEDKIYENPADESRAPELWTNASLWLKIEKLIYIHIDIVKELRCHLKELIDDDTPDHWFESTLDELERLCNTITEDLIKPTDALSDLMYKSVEIRDSRQSLQLGTSMWRLSWITFIFLPLTFLVSFFGMNVDTFENNPDIKWYFAAALPMMAVMLMVWYCIKHSISRRQHDPIRRGVYETLYQELATQHPRLWSRNGPRENVVPDGYASNLKWRLLSFWFAPERTIARSALDPAGSQMGVWSHCKNYLVRRWLGNIMVTPDSTGLSGAELGQAGLGEDQVGAVTELISFSQPVAVANGEPAAARLSTPPVPLEEIRRSSLRSGNTSRSRSHSSERGAGGEDLERLRRQMSGIMVEEKSASEDGRGEDSGTSSRQDGRDSETGVGLREVDNTISRLRRSGSAREQRQTSWSSADRLSVPILPGRASEQSPEWE